MRLFGAYKDEMSRLIVSDREIELLLSCQPTGSDELAGLENFAQALATAPTPTRDPAQMATALAATARSAARRPIRSGFSRLVVVGATMALLIAMSGIAFAADRAAPGDILYGLDRALERVGIGAGGTDERMAEFETLLRRGDEAAALAFHEKEIEGALTAGTSATSGDQAKGNGGDEPVGASDSNDPSAPDYPETGVDRDGAASPRNGENTPPGQQQTPPGQENTPPGQDKTPPGQEKPPPGQEKTHPVRRGHLRDRKGHLRVRADGPRNLFRGHTPRFMMSARGELGCSAKELTCHADTPGWLWGRTSAPRRADNHSTGAS